MVYSNTFKYCTFLLLILSATAFLQAYSPSCAAKRFKDNIQYTLSNFGKIPYGQTFIGTIYIPQDEQLCKIDKEKKINSSISNRGVMLIKRGTCKFTQKVLNAQKLGAEVAIIYDFQESFQPHLIMKNDGHGHLIQIASLFISKTDGQAFKLSQSKCNSVQTIKLAFEIQQRQKADVVFWLDANNRQSYILARDFYKHKYFDILKTQMDLSIKFRVETECQNWFCSKEDCVGILAERYCRNTEKPKEDVDYPSGKSVINEQMRQYYLWQEYKKVNPDIWWKYMMRFDDEDCIESNDVDDCSYEAMKKLIIPDSIINKIKGKINQTINNITNRENNILKQMNMEAKQYEIKFYPQATVNDRTFFGLFRSGQVFEMICNSLFDPPSECISFIKNKKIIDTTEESGIWGTIFFILILMALGFLIALVVYTKIIKKQVNQQLSLEVNKMVENYVNLTSSKNSQPSYSKFDKQ